VQAESPEHPVEHVGHAGHVAQVLQEGELEKHDDDERHEADDPAYPGDHPRNQKRAQQTVGQGAGQHGPQPVEAGLEPVHGKFAHEKGDLKHEIEHGQHDERSEEGLGENAVGLVGRGDAVAAGVRFEDALFHEGGDEPVAVVRNDGFGIGGEGVLDVLGQFGRHVLQGGRGGTGLAAEGDDILVVLQVFEGQPPGRETVREEAVGLDARFHVRQGPVDIRSVGQDQRLPGAAPLGREGDGLAHERVLAFARPGHGFHHRHAEEGGQALGIEDKPASAHFVHHVQRQDDGHAEFQELDRQVEAAFERACVHHVDDAAGLLVDQEGPGGQFVGAVGGERIHTWQVDQAKFPGIGRKMALAFLHGDTGIVAYVLSGAGQGVKERRFAAIGIAGQGEGDCRRHASPPSRPEYGRLRRCAW